MAIGVCEVDADGNIVKLHREFFSQGWIFKDQDAYDNEPNKPCYVAELDDTVYTANDFLSECNDQKEIADELFYQVDWQSPCTLINDWKNMGEITTCSICRKLFFCYAKKQCPHCGAKYNQK